MIKIPLNKNCTLFLERSQNKTQITCVSRSPSGGSSILHYLRPDSTTQFAPIPPRKQQKYLTFDI